MYKIGELSKLCNISVKALRYYDAEGLLIPDEIDKFTGYRYYSAAKLADCYRIIALKELGFSLDEIRTQLATDDNQKIMASLEAKLTELNGLRQTTETQVKRIEHMRNNLSVGENKLFNIIVRDTDELRIAFVRKNGIGEFVKPLICIFIWICCRFYERKTEYIFLCAIAVLAVVHQSK